jgi:hypothetical protein
MKKAKIMLSAIAVMGIVSGTLAFKAHQKGTNFTYAYCPASGPAGTVCPTSTIAADVLTTNPDQGSLFTTFATISSATNLTCTPNNGNPVVGQCISPLYTVLGIQ